MPEPYDLSVLEIPEDSEIHALVEQYSDVDVRRYLDGEYLTTQNETSDEIFMVLRGSYVVEQADPERAHVPPSVLSISHSDLSSISFVGEMAYLGSRVRSASVKSSGICHTLCLLPKHLDAIISDYPVLTQGLCREFSQRLRETNEIIQRQQQVMAMDVSRQDLQPGEILFKEGDKASLLYQLVDGTVTLTRPSGTETHSPSTLFMGFLEPAAFFKNAAHTATATAKTTVVAAAISSTTKTAVVRNYPQLLLALFKESPDR